MGHRGKARLCCKALPGARRARSFCLRGISTGALANIVKCLRYLADSRALAKEDQGRRGPGMTKAGFCSTDWFPGIGVDDMGVGV
jgi:hypothetical protein